MKKRTLLGCLGLLAIVLFAFLGLVLYMRYLTRPRLPHNFVLYVSLEGSIADFNPSHWYDPLLQIHRPPSVYELVHGLDAAARDKRVKGVVLRPRLAGMGVAKLQEIVTAIARLRETKKPVVAYLDLGMDNDYLVGLAGNEIVMSPVGMIFINGLYSEALYPKRLFDKLGVEFQVVRFGRYKSAAEFFTEEHMSPETREMLTWILDSLNRQVREIIKTYRPGAKLTWDEMVDRGIFTAQTLQEAGMVDRLESWNDFKARIKDQWARKWVSLERYLQAPPKPRGRERVKCGLVFAVGGIVDGRGEPGETIGSDRYLRYFRKLERDQKISCLLIRDDSPGGSGLASDQIWAAVERLKKAGKHVVVSMSDVAGSGGYYIAMNAEQIVAHPGTITGSIGVFSSKPIIKRAMDKLGIGIEEVKTHPHAGFMSPFTYLDEQQMEGMRAETEKFYWSFVDKVAQGRGMTREAVHAIAEGRIWTGAQAKQKGLVDRLGGFYEARQALLELLHKPPDTVIEWVVYPRRKTFFESLLGQNDTYTQMLYQAGVRDRQLVRRLRPYFEALHAPVMAIMPPIRIR